MADHSVVATGGNGFIGSRVVAEPVERSGHGPSSVNLRAASSKSHAVSRSGRVP